MNKKQENTPKTAAINDNQRIKKGQVIGINFTEDIVGDVTALNSQVITEHFFPEGIVTASGHYSSSVPKNAFEDSNSAWYLYENSGWIQIEMRDTSIIKGFRWECSSRSYIPQNFEVLGSVDGINWTSLYTGVNEQVTGFQEHSWEPSEQRFNFYRWKINSSFGSRIQIRRIELLPTVGNEIAFTVKGMERKSILSPLVEREFPVEKVDKNIKKFHFTNPSALSYGINASSEKEPDTDSDGNITKTYYARHILDMKEDTIWMAQSNDQTRSLTLSFPGEKRIYGIEITRASTFNFSIFRNGEKTDKGNYSFSRTNTKDEVLRINFTPFYADGIELKLSSNSGYISGFRVIGSTRYEEEWVSNKNSQIYLSFANLNTERLKNLEGGLSISYDQSLGNLTGIGGAVEDFTTTFLPTGIVKKPNPHSAENIQVGINSTVSILEPIWHLGYNKENLSVNINATIDLINVEQVDP